MKGDLFEDFFSMIPIFTEICSYESKLQKNMFQACGMSFLEAYMELNDISRLEARKHQPRATGKAGPTMTSVTELCAKVTSQLSLPKIATRGVSRYLLAFPWWKAHQESQQPGIENMDKAVKYSNTIS